MSSSTDTVLSSDKYDDRPLVSDLLSTHSEAIRSVRDSIHTDVTCDSIYHKGDNANYYDEIWILRFILSHKGDIDAATTAALKTMKFRDEKKMNELGDIRHKILNFGDPDDEKLFRLSIGEDDAEFLPGWKEFNGMCAQHTGFNVQPDDDRGLIVIFDTGKLDMERAGTEMTQEEMTEFVLHQNEVVYQILDGVTRRTGRLTKLMKLVDMENMELHKINLTYIQRDAASSKTIEDYYPQLLGTLILVNSPWWLAGFWNMLRPLFPQRFVEKVDFLPPFSDLTSKDQMEPIFRYISEEHLPEKYGGQNKEWPMTCAGRKYSS